MPTPVTVPRLGWNMEEGTFVEWVKPDGAATVLRPLLRHGILQQRTADILTDSFRALILASWATGPTWWSSSAPSTRRGT